MARRHLAMQGAVAFVLCALAGCQVPTEGAPCQTDASCPGGQRCGADQRCSVKAAGCTECADGEKVCVDGGLATCEPAPDGICRAFSSPVAPEDHQLCDESTRGAAKFVCRQTACEAEGPACASGAWTTCAADVNGCLYGTPGRSCAADGLLCGAAANTCVCPAAGDTFYVDPVAGSDVGADPAPTGAAAPPRCRYKALGPALQAANARAGSAAGGTATVAVSAPEEARPLTLTSTETVDLMPGVTLTSDAEVNPDGPPGDLPYVLEVSATPGVRLHEGATFSRFELRPAQDASVTDAIVTSCAAPSADDPARVEDAVVLGMPGTDGVVRFGNGVHQMDGCPISVERTLLERNSVGVSSSRGTLRIDRCKIDGGQTGILLDRTNLSGTPQNLQALISDSWIGGAADTGVRIVQLDGANSVTFTGNTITGNCAVQEFALLGRQRRGGGVLVVGRPTIPSFTGNIVAGNGWDQVLVTTGEGEGSLNLSGGSCPLPSQGLGPANQFCPDSPRAAVGVFSGGAAVDARFNAWSSDGTPEQGRDFDGRNVDAGVSTNEYCQNLVPCASYPAPSCP
jgi:hypothetical protein